MFESSVACVGIVGLDECARLEEVSGEWGRMCPLLFVLCSCHVHVLEHVIKDGARGVTWLRAARWLPRGCVPCGASSHSGVTRGVVRFRKAHEVFGVEFKPWVVCRVVRAVASVGIRLRCVVDLFGASVPHRAGRRVGFTWLQP